METGKIVGLRSGILTPNKQMRTTSARSASKNSSTPFSPASSICSIGSSSRELAKQAKLQSTAERIRKVNMLKEKWAKDKENKAVLNKEKKALTIKTLNDESELNCTLQRKNLEKQMAYELQEKERLREMLKDSVETRTQLAADLEAKAKAKRRISVFLNGKIRKNALEKEAQMEMKRKQEQIDELSSRRIDYLQIRQAKREEELNRRESFIQRGIAAKAQRDAEAKLAQQAAEEEASLLETRHLNWQDTLKFKEMTEKQRRESIAHRLNHWREERHATEKEITAQQQLMQDLLHTRHLDSNDMKQYKKQQSDRNRKSLIGRIAKWHEQNLDERRKADLQRNAKLIEADLAKQIHLDLLAYRKKIQEDRRASMEFRTEKAYEARAFEVGLKGFADLMEEERKEEQAKDKEYMLQKQQEVRYNEELDRKYRARSQCNAREAELAELQAQKERDALDYQLREAAWRDMKEHQARQREEARRSIAGRIAEAHRIHELELQEHRRKLDEAHRDFELKRLDYKEMRAYREEERVRSRRSIALRLASWKEDRVTEEKEKAKILMQLEEDALLREQDREQQHAAMLANNLIEKHNMLSGDMLFK